jgi:hypothetical protein
MIILAVGAEGIDIYNYNQNFNFHSNLNKAELKLNETNIVDISASEDESMLYLLDRKKGLIIFDLNKMVIILIKIIRF